MITLNINIDDKLVIGMFGKVANFFISKKHVKAGRLKFGDINIG